MTISQTNTDRLLTRFQDASEDFGPIVQVDHDRRVEAIRRLLAVDGRVDHIRTQRFMAFSTSNDIPLDAMWSRLDAQDRIVHTVLAMPNPGRTAMLFVTKPAGKGEIAPIAGLIDHVCLMLAERHITLGQVLLDPSESWDREAFLKGGFIDLAKLSYMERQIPKRSARGAIPWPKGVHAEAYRDESEGDLLAILEASYEDTLDCPGLRGLRDTRDIYLGHRSTGEFDPDLWTILRVDGKPGGVLMLNPIPSHQNVELVYIGLAKFARGRGLAKCLLQHGLHQLAVRAYATVTLAVDDQNAPALGLYAKAGFRRALRRIAMIRDVSNRSQAH